jgi:hypothetical protein
VNRNRWQGERDGGSLRLHLLPATGEGGGKEGGEREGACPLHCPGGACHRDVECKAGRIVLFKSRELLHEVIITSHPILLLKIKIKIIIRSIKLWWN